MMATLEPADRVRALLNQGILWDNHACMPLKADATSLPLLEKHRAAGFHVVSLNVGMADIPLIEHLRVLSFMRQWLQQRSDLYRLVETVDDVHRCKADGKLGIVFDVEGMSAVQDDPSFVQTFYELGVRWMLVAYNLNNRAGGGCLDDDIGLTDIGRAIIDEMERVGMVLCLSHAGERTVRDALDYARNPTIFSHSNPAGDAPHPRNVGDAVMLECARKGGVIGLNGFETFLGGGDDLIDSLARQLFYAIDLVGPAHVGLSLDYCYDAEDLARENRENAHLYPPGMENDRFLPPECVDGIVERLARSNLTDAEIGGILGGNWLRVASAVWK